MTKETDDNTEALKSGNVPPGVQADSYIDGRAKRWSWGCKCGEWDDGYPSRFSARGEYLKHRANCVVFPIGRKR